MIAGTNRIITPLIVAFILATTAPTFAGKIIYVDDDTPADFNNIQAAINYSNHGDTIIVAEGRYFENINFNGRNITLKSTNPNDPDVVAATIIDGRQKGSVVTFRSDEDENCVLNGFTITNGKAKFGGGIHYRWISGPLCPPPSPFPPPPPFPPLPPPPPPGTLSEQSSPEVLYEPECYGPMITNCIISNNSADSGGGMDNEAPSWSESKRSLTLINCAFNGNSASVCGGGISNYYSIPTLTNCTFTDNSAGTNGFGWDGGAGMYNSNSNPTLKNCTFNNNSATYDGGGMYNSNSSPILTNCTFSGNSAVDDSQYYGSYGGGMANFDSSPTLSNCTFKENSASREGGGMYNNHSNPIVANCTFSKNSAVSTNWYYGYGGGMFNVYSNPTLTNCTFKENSVSREGGGMYNNHSSPIVDNCMFIGNAAGYYHGRGGGMYNAYSDPLVTNCTFSGNTEVSQNYRRRGGGMYNSQGCYTMVSNCIFWGNGIYERSGSVVDVTYSDIEGGWPGKGNIEADPRFVDLGYWDSNDTPHVPWDDVWFEGDYHLLPDSPCINAGDPNHLYDPNERDLDGNPRVIGCRIDMGAFDYRHLVPAEVRIVPHTINLANRGKWITAYLQFPENYNVAEIDFCIMLLEDEIQPEQLFINEKEQVIMARFNNEQLQGILNTGDIELKISAQLTDATVFEGTDVIKVIYEGGGKLAKLGKAGNPNPADGATDVRATADLSWTAGFNSTSHDVYFGTSSPPPFIVNRTAATFDPGTMDYDTTYFWRIDEVNKWNKTTGDLWSFTTLRRPPPPPPPPM